MSLWPKDSQTIFYAMKSLAHPALQLYLDKANANLPLQARSSLSGVRKRGLSASRDLDVLLHDAEVIECYFSTQFLVLRFVSVFVAAVP